MHNGLLISFLGRENKVVAKYRKKKKKKPLHFCYSVCSSIEFKIFGEGFKLNASFSSSINLMAKNLFTSLA